MFRSLIQVANATVKQKPAKNSMTSRNKAAQNAGYFNSAHRAQQARLRRGETKTNRVTHQKLNKIGDITTRTEEKVDKILEAVAPVPGETATSVEIQIQQMRLKSMKLRKGERQYKEAQKLEVRFLKLLSVHADLATKYAAVPEGKKPALMTKMINTISTARTTVEAIAAMDGLVGFEDNIANMRSRLADVEASDGDAPHGDAPDGDAQQSASSSSAPQASQLSSLLILCMAIPITPSRGATPLPPTCLKPIFSNNHTGRPTFGLARARTDET